MGKKVLSITIGIAKSIFFIVLCFLIFVVFTSRLSGGDATVFGYQLKAVLSGSMEPSIQTGSIISIKVKDKPTLFQKNEIITFRMDDKYITHRIIETQKVNGEISYKTKGDNNDGPDLWTVSPNQIIGKYSGFTIPYIGFALNYVGTKTGSALLFIIPGVFLTLSAIRTILHTKKEIEQKIAG